MRCRLSQVREVGVLSSLTHIHTPSLRSLALPISLFLSRLFAFSTFLPVRGGGGGGGGGASV